MILTTPNKASIFFRHAPDHFKEYTFPEIGRLLESTGFQVEKHSFVPFRVPRTGLFIPWLQGLFPSLGRNMVVLARKP